jgi:transposase
MITISKNEFNGLLSIIEELRAEIKSLKAELALVKEENQQLKEEIRLLKNGKKSNTSHTPPSQDFGRSNQKNSREISGKKSGGQKGHKGFTLEMKNNPDEVIKYSPDFCTNCSTNLENELPILECRKQEVVIPSFKAAYIEHQLFSKTCQCCGNKVVAKLPDNIIAPIQYGESVTATISYLSVYQYVPYNRIKKMMNDLFHISISEGTIKNILEKMAQRALPMYEVIQSRVMDSKLVGGDETGTKIGKEKGWFHVWQNTKLTFIVASFNRGYSTVEEYFSLGFSNAIYVSDCWSSQLKVPALKHQLCFAHLLRELKNFEESFECEWSLKMKELLQKAIKLKNQMSSADYFKPPISISEIENELDELLNIDSGNFHKKQKAFIKRLTKNRQSMFVFLEHEFVPFDNNGSERAIRNVKVKNKISGCFRTFEGAVIFAVLRSVIDTTIKNSQDVFSSIQLIAKFKPE